MRGEAAEIARLRPPLVRITVGVHHPAPVARQQRGEADGQRAQFFVEERFPQIQEALGVREEFEQEPQAVVLVARPFHRHAVGGVGVVDDPEVDHRIVEPGLQFGLHGRGLGVVPKRQGGEATGREISPIVVRGKTLPAPHREAAPVFVEAVADLFDDLRAQGLALGRRQLIVQPVVNSRQPDGRLGQHEVVVERPPSPQRADPAQQPPARVRVRRASSRSTRNDAAIHASESA